MKRIATISIGFVHDAATGCWAATVLAVAYLHRTVVSDQVAEVLTGLEQRFFWVGLGCTILVFATGAGRTFTYVADHYGPDAEAARRRSLMVKHLILLAVFGTGTIWQYRMAFGAS